MTIDRIEAMIASHCHDEDANDSLCELLAAVSEASDIDPDPDDLEQGARFVLGYIEQVPYMIKVARTAAAQVGLSEEMDQIIGMALSYWLQDEDLIPDHLGVIGLLDDAYCSLASLQAVSDIYRLQTGKHLFPDDLTAANRAMRQIIGEPYVTQLEQVVNAAIHDAGVMAAIKALASPEKQLSLANNATIWNHGPAGSLPMEQLAGLGLARDD